MLPIFVKGHLTFSLDEHVLEFVHQNISVFGVTGLPWPPLDPTRHFGQAVQAQVRIPSSGTPSTLNFKTRAYLLRESTNRSEQMGLHFHLDAESRAQLETHISRHGFYPTEYIRKYPRIPSLATVQTFPLRALVTQLALPDEHATDRVRLPGDEQIIFDVGNLSPNGILLHTENQLALSIRPGDRLEMKLEPRGWFPMQLTVQGMVCRIVDELDPSSGNIARYLGMKFTRISDVDRAAFLNLLKDILERLQKKQA